MAGERGYVSADTKVGLKQRGFGASQQNVPALVIPLHDVWGELAGYQARPDCPRVKNGRPLKYETPIGKRMVLDVPPRVRPHLGDPNRPLFITEGSRKADAAVTAGLDCVALLGVWNWRGTNEEGGKVALPDWEAVALNGRQVYICFDSDVMLKPAVHGALGRLMAFLATRGADVAVIYLPAGEAGRKVGLDDFVCSAVADVPPGQGVDGEGVRAVDLLLTLASPDLRPLPNNDDGPEAEPVDTFDDIPAEPGNLVLDDIAELLARYVAFAHPTHRDAVALWCAHTHAVDAAESTPRLVLSSPSKQSGKTRTLELLELLVHRPKLRANTSAAALFRSVAKARPSLLLDEIDAIFGPKAGEHEELRGLLNAGHRRGATVDRCVGDGAALDVAEFPVFCAVALAGIGTLPDTITDRAVVIPMRRRAPGEHVAEFRRKRVEPEATVLRRRLAAWSARNLDVLADADPQMPSGLTDRPADVWEALLAIADRAGGTWPDRLAAVTLNDARADAETNYAVRILGELRTVFDAEHAERVPTEHLVNRLNDPDDAPWAKWNKGDGIDARDLAKQLKPYGVHPKKLRNGDSTFRGYLVDDLADAWARYLPAATPEIDGTSGTSHPHGRADCSAVPLVPPTQGVDGESVRVAQDDGDGFLFGSDAIDDDHQDTTPKDVVL